MNLEALADVIRAHTGLTSKNALATLPLLLDTSDPIGGPGDDGALLTVGSQKAIVCGEAIHPNLVAADPFAAGVAAVVANVNDVAAMGGYPDGIVNTVVGSQRLATEVLKGIRHACDLYGIKVLGGHFTQHLSVAAVSAFAVGTKAANDTSGSVTRVEAGQMLVFACCLDGDLRHKSTIFSTLTYQAPYLRDHIRLPAEVLHHDGAQAARDVSMAGAIGSLAMLLEYRQCGALVDLKLMPQPAKVELSAWLTAFPSYAFWFTAAAEDAARCVERFHNSGLAAAVVGTVTKDPTVVLRQGELTAEVMNLEQSAVTGLWRPRAQ